MKKKKKFSFMLIFNIISLIIILFLIYLLYKWNKENTENNQLQQDLIDTANITVDDSSTVSPDSELPISPDSIPKNISVDFNSLSKTNKNVVRLA